MATILNTKSIYFNDVNILPQMGVVKSRSEINTELHRIIVSPMLSVVGQTFIKEAARLGLSVATPRFLPTEEKLDLLRLFHKEKANEKQLCFLAIGLNEPDEELEKISHNTVYNDSILVDVANGYVPSIQDAVERVYGEISVIKNLMIGNVVTYDGVNSLFNKLLNKYKYSDSLYVRVGIGNGKPCSSSDVTAVNRGQITELIDCSGIKEKTDKTFLVSDGGISKPGFVIKAFGAGADYCLMGGYFSKALEAETNINGDGTYFGCASEKQNKLAGLNKHSEGKEIKINKEELKPLEYLVSELKGGIASGISYCGYKNVSDFIGNGVFEAKQNSLPPKSRV